MRIRIAVPIAACLAAAACVPSAAQEPAGENGGSLSEESAPSEDAPRSEAAPSPEARAPHAIATDQEAVRGDIACSFLDRVGPSQPGPGVPRIGAPSGVAIRSVRADIKLGEAGAMTVRFTVRLANPGSAEAEAEIGYAFRSQGGAPPKPLAERVRFADGVEARTCFAKSPDKLHAVYVDEAVYAVLRVPAGGEAQLEGEAHFEARRASWPMTLFGFEDSAALNLRNFSWSYIGDPVYAAAADRARPYETSFDLADGEEVRVIVSAENRRNQIRAMSHEQNGMVLRSPGMFAWNFEGGGAPPRVWFEFNPDLDVRDEIALYKTLAASRPTDLRVLIRLTDLLRFGGDKSERAALVEKLLAVWDANAKAQLLTGGNDVKDAAFVALVRSLDLAGEKPAAKAKAREALAALGGIDASSPDHAKRSVAWLKAYAEKAE